MVKRSTLVPAASAVAVLAALLGRAVTVHSVGPIPLIYRVIANNNDLDGVQGLAPPGRTVELWYRQRNFVEGDLVYGSTDPFSWCGWKNDGHAVMLGWTQADGNGVWSFQHLRDRNTVMIFPAGPNGNRCLGGVYTELLPRACDSPGVNCTAWSVPVLHNLNVRKLTPIVGAAAGSVSGASQAAIAVADGPNDGTEPTDVVDVDQNGIDTTLPGFVPGQRVTWKCGAGGTAVCPSVAIHDASTVVTPDPEYPFVLGTIQAHRDGGSFIAAASIARGQPLGFAVTVNVKFRGRLDVNLGCDRKQPFDFGLGNLF